MLTPAALARTSQAYRRGYYDAIEGKSFANPYNVDHFAGIDYREGFEAGANDLKWSKK